MTQAFMGNFSESPLRIQALPEPDSPVVRVSGRAVMGRTAQR